VITYRKRSEEDMQAAQAELQRLLSEADQSRLVLLSLVEDQKQAQERINQLNVELEQRVRDRTLQLESANKELEAFAYSVSHDLRAPLRAMDGFSAALLSDYPDQLDEKGRHYLERIQEASRRMGQLINDLLNLSRVTRTDFKRQRVDLSGLAQQVINNLNAQDPQRAVEWDIAPDLIVQGDVQLLRIVMENLLNNAYKFSSKSVKAQIGVGAVERAGEQVYFVRDNGVGFDMEYAGKLFAPFQRLHNTQEFPGTGIGLVTVQRIIHRHGGRIWPEAELGRGAAFYFTLGGN
jgi:light-regulated signal transduction histidine kinase (bacteriophytochrome)